MAEVRPFRGARYSGSSLTGRLCPPYDVISSELGARLRRAARNAVFLELPQGPNRYQDAASLWKSWLGDGTLRVDSAPAFYAVEETYKLDGVRRVRRGFLAALGVVRGAETILPHERTLSKPKADRLKMLKTVGANISPVFGVFSDPSAAVRRALERASRGRPIARGKSSGGVDYRVWRLDDPRSVAAVEATIARQRVLIADGHHRFEVSRALSRSRRAGSDSILAYLVADQDPGLAVLPTHRIVKAALVEKARAMAALKPARGLEELKTRLARDKNPYAFGLIDRGYWLCLPKKDGCRSGLSVEWLSRRLLADIPPDQMSYSPDAPAAVRAAKGLRGSAVLVKPFSVEQVRRAALRVGLLPQKSTYFFPKIATGLVFRPLAP